MKKQNAVARKDRKLRLEKEKIGKEIERMGVWKNLAEIETGPFSLKEPLSACNRGSHTPSVESHSHILSVGQAEAVSCWPASTTSL